RIVALYVRPRVRLRPPAAAVLEAEARQHRGHADRCANSFDHRHAPFLAQHIRLHVYRALRDAVHDDHVGAVLLDQRTAGGDEVLFHRVLVGADVLELVAGGAPACDPGLHAVGARLGDLPRNNRLVIADDAETVAELSRNVEHGLAWPDDRDVHERAAAVDAEIERPEGHRGVVAFLFGLDVARVIVGRDELDFGRSQPPKRLRRYRYDSDFDLCG